jgi:small neutral amino acid transporter SnatA (MarC family)
MDHYGWMALTWIFGSVLFALATYGFKGTSRTDHAVAAVCLCLAILSHSYLFGNLILEAGR